MKVLETKYKATMEFCGGGGVVLLQNKTEPWREHGYFLELHAVVSAKCKLLFHFLWKYGQIDDAN